jgi:PhoH-like ATPase
MDKTVLIDTNLYLDDPNIINKLAGQYDKILIPVTVLKELDKKKYHKDLAYSARNAIRAILDFTSHHMDQTIFDVTPYEDAEPDSRIIASAKKYSAVLATKDISMSIIADSMGLKTMIHDTVMNNIFKPYVYVDMNDLFEASEEDTFSYNQEYSDEEDYLRMLAIFSKIAGYELDEDAWWFAIIDVKKETPIIYANNPMKNKLVRIDNRSEYREIRTEGSNIKARDCYQVCAIYAMIEAPNALICGAYGTGKSLLASAYAIAYGDKKTFISRPNLSVDRRFDLGFLPGSMAEKLSPWMAGFISSLYYIFSNTKGQTTDKMPVKGMTYDFVKDQIFKKYFEMVPLDSLQGTSFMEGDLLILDETQLCSVSILSIILSRFGVGSKLIMTGDVMQTYGIIPPSENGLLKLLRLLPNKNIAYVILLNNYRSGLVELADGLQDKSF